MSAPNHLHPLIPWALFPFFVCDLYERDRFGNPARTDHVPGGRSHPLLGSSKIPSLRTIVHTLIMFLLWTGWRRLAFVWHSGFCHRATTSRLASRTPQLKH